MNASSGTPSHRDGRPCCEAGLNPKRGYHSGSPITITSVHDSPLGCQSLTRADPIPLRRDSGMTIIGASTMPVRGHEPAFDAGFVGVFEDALVDRPHGQHAFGSLLAHGDYGRPPGRTPAAHRMRS